MKIWILLMSLCTPWISAEVPGHAAVELWLGKAKKSPDGGRIIPAVLSMQYEKGWHGYWINPGEGGVKTTMRWQLPPGVEVSEWAFPVPHRLMTGDLACYGYEGEVMMASEIRVQADVAEDAEISGELRWLACDEKSCVPGKVRLVARLSDAGKHADKESKIELVHQSIVRPAPELSWHVREENQEVHLVIEGAHDLRLEGTEFFPETEQVLDPKQELRWQKTAQGYEARARKNEYAEGPVKELRLWILPPKPQVARWIEWKKS